MGRNSRIASAESWIDARTRHHLTDAQVQMARELGMNPKKLGKLDTHRQQPWKLPLPRYIEELYFKRFGKAVPDNVASIEDRLRREREKKDQRRAARRERRAVMKQTRDRRWIDGRELNLAEEVRYMQWRAAEGTSRVVSIGPLLLFAAESGDAWMLDPADRLATRIAEQGAPDSVYIDETADTFAVGWRGRYEIAGPAFVFTDGESGRVTAILGYPIREIAAVIAEVFGRDPNVLPRR